MAEVILFLTQTWTQTLNMAIDTYRDFGWKDHGCLSGIDLLAYARKVILCF